MNFEKVALFLYLGSAILPYSRRDKSSQTLFISALIIQALGLTLWSIQVGHLPIFTPAETLSSLGFTVGLLTLCLYWHSPNRFLVQRWALLFIVLLLATAVLWPTAPPCFDYNHSYLYALLFHLFRRLALAFSLFAGAIFIRKNGDEK